MAEGEVADYDFTTRAELVGSMAATLGVDVSVVSLSVTAMSTPVAIHLHARLFTSSLPLAAAPPWNARRSHKRPARLKT